MTATFIIYGRLPSLNEVIGANRSNRYAGANLKRRVQSDIGWAIRAFALKPIAGPVAVSVTWYEANRRRDVDNVSSSIKFILDALVKCGILAGDGQRHVTSVSHTVAVDRLNPRIVVTLEQVTT